MAIKIKRVVWDSCVVIDAIQATPERWERIEPFAKEAEAGRLQIVISEVNVAEILHLKRLGDGGMTIENQVALIRQWLMNPYIVRRPVHRGISELAAEIGRKYGVKGAADCIVVATAIDEGIEIIHSFDGDRDKTSHRKLLNFDGRIGSPPLRITVPDFLASTIFENDSPNPPERSARDTE